MTKFLFALAMLLAPLAAFGAQPAPTFSTLAPLTNNGQAATTAYADSAVAVEQSRAMAAENAASAVASAAQATANAAYSAAYTVQSDAALRAYPTALMALGTSVLETGYTVAGDAPIARYTFTTQNCQLNNHAGDGGSQIPGNGGGCWILIPGQAVDARNFGATPGIPAAQNPVIAGADQAPYVQNWITYMGSQNPGGSQAKITVDGHAQTYVINTPLIPASNEVFLNQQFNATDNTNFDVTCATANASGSTTVTLTGCSAVPVKGPLIQGTVISGTLPTAQKIPYVKSVGTFTGSPGSYAGTITTNQNLTVSLAPVQLYGAIMVTTAGSNITFGDGFQLDAGALLNKPGTSGTLTKADGTPINPLMDITGWLNLQQGGIYTKGLQIYHWASDGTPGTGAGNYAVPGVGIYNAGKIVLEDYNIEQWKSSDPQAPNCGGYTIGGVFTPGYNSGYAIVEEAIGDNTYIAGNAVGGWSTFYVDDGAGVIIFDHNHPFNCWAVAQTGGPGGISTFPFPTVDYQMYGNNEVISTDYLDSGEIDQYVTSNHPNPGLAVTGVATLTGNAVPTRAWVVLISTIPNGNMGNFSFSTVGNLLDHGQLPFLRLTQGAGASWGQLNGPLIANTWMNQKGGKSFEQGPITFFNTDGSNGYAAQFASSSSTTSICFADQATLTSANGPCVGSSDQDLIECAATAQCIDISATAANFISQSIVASQGIVSGQSGVFGDNTPYVITSTTGVNFNQTPFTYGPDSVILRSGPTAAFTDNFPTASAIIAHLPAGATAGTSFIVSYQNNSTATATLAGSTGITVAGNTSVPAGTWQDYEFTVTNIATPAITAQAMRSGYLIGSTVPTALPNVADATYLGNASGVSMAAYSISIPSCGNPQAALGYIPGGGVGTGFVCNNFSSSFANQILSNLGLGTGFVEANGTGAATVVSTIPIASGGTGATTLSGYLVGNGTSAITAVSSLPLSAFGTGFSADYYVGTNTAGALTALAWPACINNGYSLNYSPGSGVGCAQNANLTLSNLGLGSGYPKINGTGAVTVTAALPLSALASQAANTVVGATTTGSPSALTLPNCASAGSAVTYSLGSGFGCASLATSGSNSNITQLNGLTSPLNSSSGGTGAAALTGYLYSNGASAATAATTIPTSALSGSIALSALASQAANILVGTGSSTGNPTAIALPSCSAANNALQYSTSGGAFSCVTISTPAPTLLANQFYGSIAGGAATGLTFSSCSANGDALTYVTGSGPICGTAFAQTNVANSFSATQGFAAITASSMTGSGAVSMGHFTPTGGSGSVNGMFQQNTTTLGLYGPISHAGTTFTISGCSATTPTGGPEIGTYASGTTGSCAVTVTINGATGATASNGWACFASDRTTPADAQVETATTTHTATITGTTVSGDVIQFNCEGY